jgi:hypothetical protein
MRNLNITISAEEEQALRRAIAGLVADERKTVLWPEAAEQDGAGSRASLREDF